MGKTTNKKDVELNIVYRNIKELKPYKNNAKKHPKEQVERIMNSIKQFGFFEHRAVAIEYVYDMKTMSNEEFAEKYLK